MKSLFAKTALAAATVLSVGAAQASVIDFENVDMSGLSFAPLVSNNEILTQGPFFMQGYDGNGSSDPGLVGSLIGPKSGGSCDGAGIACPTGDSTDYYATLNTGVLYMQGPHDMTLTQFDAGFIAPAGGVPNGAFGLLVVEGDRADKSYAIGAYKLSGPDASGSTSFSTFQAAGAMNDLFGGTTGTIDQGGFADYQFLEFYCSSSSLGSCSLDRSNLGQFALDNVTFAVPEPSSWALMAFGLAVVGSAARRRRSV
ncbi:NF038120 family PEP-CTERM protein [Scleromatobacter humisilvae]|uniref:NF038120 family PEP-CTERM protein n=1 Tax=Scleromatobacter humisilvae TaxID=2897159 RepID=A0A9X1YEX8_9BURK|nr:NF038120 family PEP-CTERM protein [Scleromatobacter humisilvae]MCK9684758.1 NF038120 family PEP-CTERM protein [Scleromatobacter humisilvae]